MAQEIERPLLMDKLCSGDRPSLVAAGMAVAHSLQSGGVAVLVVDALGRVSILPPSHYKILSGILLRDHDLDSMTEDEAISVMVHEERDETEILAYLTRRAGGTSAP